MPNQNLQNDIAKTKSIQTSDAPVENNEYGGLNRQANTSNNFGVQGDRELLTKNEAEHEAGRGNEDAVGERHWGKGEYLDEEDQPGEADAPPKGKRPN